MKPHFNFGYWGASFCYPVQESDIDSLYGGCAGLHANSCRFLETLKFFSVLWVSSLRKVDCLKRICSHDICCLWSNSMQTWKIVGNGQLHSFQQIEMKVAVKLFNPDLKNYSLPNPHWRHVFLMARQSKLVICIDLLQNLLKVCCVMFWRTAIRDFTVMLNYYLIVC